MSAAIFFETDNGFLMENCWIGGHVGGQKTKVSQKHLKNFSV